MGEGGQEIQISSHKINKAFGYYVEYGENSQ